MAPDIGERRYLAMIADYERLKALAAERGMPADGELGDYCEFDEANEIAEFKSMEAAKDHCRANVERDLWNAPRIYVQEWGDDPHDDLGRPVARMDHWEGVETWEYLGNEFDRIDEFA